MKTHYKSLQCDCPECIRLEQLRALKTLTKEEFFFVENQSLFLLEHNITFALQCAIRKLWKKHFPIIKKP